MVKGSEQIAPPSGYWIAVTVPSRIHFMQRWFNLSEPTVEEALHDIPMFCDFAGMSHWDENIFSESSILRFQHLLERHKLAEQIQAFVKDGPACN